MRRGLRIFLCCQQALRPHPIPAYGFWVDYFRAALSEAGHTIIEAANCDWAEGLIPQSVDERSSWLNHTWNVAVEHIKREHAKASIDFFLSYLFPQQIEPAAVECIRSLGVPCVNFFCDNVREFRRVPSQFLRFDLHWVPEYKALPLYQRSGIPALHAPMPCYLPHKYRTPAESESQPITFVGTRDEQREKLFGDAIRSGLMVTLRGTGWTNDALPAKSPIGQQPAGLSEIVRRQLLFAREQGCRALFRRHTNRIQRLQSAPFDFTPYAGPPLDSDSYWTTLRESTVCIGVNRYPSFRFPVSKPDTYSRLRDIEAPMAGACYLTEWTEGLDQLYELGDEIETYRTPGELAARADELSRDVKRRTTMRRKAQNRALSHHSIQATIDRIATHLGLPTSPPCLNSLP